MLVVSGRVAVSEERGALVAAVLWLVLSLVAATE